MSGGLAEPRETPHELRSPLICGLRFMYDAVGNQYGFENANGWFSSTLFDPLNRVWVEFTPEPIAFTSYTRTHTYDADGREIQVRDPNSGIVTTMYSARNEVATLVHT